MGIIAWNILGLVARMIHLAAAPAARRPKTGHPAMGSCGLSTSLGETSALMTSGPEPSSGRRRHG
jgi:hypothetical protein